MALLRARLVMSVVTAGTLTFGVLGANVPAFAQPGGVVISELHYHAGTDLDTDDFLELANTGAEVVNIGGWSFTAGITLTFPAGAAIPAGGYVVVAKDAARFQSLYGFAPVAAYSGNLSNGGETVTLVDGAAAVIDTVTYADAAPWPPAADGTGPSLELRGLLYDNTLPENWGASTVTGGTPGAVNSLDGTAPPPRATAVQATPQRPAPSEPVVITARLPVGSIATLSYKVMFSTDLQVSMLDDAASPGGSGDGVFGATIPGQSAGRLVRYRIDATAGNNQAFSYPAAGDTVNYAGVVVRNPSVSTNLPVLEWFMEDATYNDLLANHRYDNVTGQAVIAYDGTVYDNVAMRIRGNTTRSRPKVAWKVEMPSGHDFDMGAKLPYQLDEFAIMGEAEPLADVSWNTVGAAGARRLAILPVRTQRNGQFWSVGKVMELEDGTWRDAQGVSKWSIYKGDGGSLARTSSPAVLAATTSAGCPLCQPEPWLDKKTRKDESYADVWTLSQFIDAPASATQRAWIDENVNIPEMINYLAINSVMRHADSGWYNWWVARDTEGTGRWEMWHWDLNWTFTTDADDGKGEFLTPDTSNRFTKAMLGYPDLREMFYRRLRTLADQLLVPTRYEQEWDAISGPYLSDWNLDRAAWGGYTPSGSRTKFLAGVTDRRTVLSANSGAGKPVPPSQSSAPDVVINEIMYHPAGAADAEYVELYNPSLTESVDLSGWTLDGAGLTIQPGTVLLPQAYAVLVRKDTAFRAAYPGGGRFVAGQYASSLADTGGTLTLRQGARVVDTVSYSATDPWPSSADGTGPSLELRDWSSDNSLAASWSANSAVTGTPGKANSTVTPPDTTPPSAPGTVTASGVGQTQLTLNWGAASDNVAVTGYRLTRNGTTLPATVSGLTFTDTGLSPATTYSYTVRALDAAGNVGPAGNTLQVTTAADTGTAFSDTWTAPDGSAWGSAWTSDGVSGTVTDQGGTGQLAVNDIAGAYARAQLTGLTARADSDTTFSYRWNSGTPVGYLSVFVRGSGGWRNGYRPTNGYGLELASNSSSITITKTVAGTTTSLNTTSGAQVVGSGRQWLRLRVSASTIQYKTWLDGQAEPSTWRGTVTDTSVTAAGQLFVSLNRGSSNTGAKSVQLDDLAVR
jgi:chitodextrinase